MIVIGVTGSIAIYKSCYIVNELVKKGKKVKVVMTNNAKSFISPLTFQSLSGDSVLTDMFGKDINQYHFPHINLAQEAKVIAIVPATANIISKLAAGICDDTLTCLMISSNCPKIIAPAMNEKMYLNPIIKKNIEKLKTIGYKVIPSIKGHLACGYDGDGHLAKEEDIINSIIKYSG